MGQIIDLLLSANREKSFEDNSKNVDLKKSTIKKINEYTASYVQAKKPATGSDFSLFQFHSTSKYSLSNLFNSQIYLNHFVKMNNINEIAPFIDYEKLAQGQEKAEEKVDDAPLSNNEYYLSLLQTNGDQVRRAEEMIRNSRANIDASELQTMVCDIFRTMNKNHAHQAKTSQPVKSREALTLTKECYQGIDDWFMDQLKTSLVSCFSEDIHSPILWRNYAQSEQGYVLEYAYQDLLKAKQEDLQADELYLMPVEYLNEQIDFTEFLAGQANLENYIRSNSRLVEQFMDISIYQELALMFSKHLNWGYEKEWRFAIPKSELLDGRFMSIKPKCIYLGKIVPSVRSMIINFAKQNNIAVKEISYKRPKRDYSLDFIDIQ